MSSLKRPFLITSLVACALLPLGACADSPWARSLQQSLAADPQLEENPALFGGTETSASNPSQNEMQAQLPANFPDEIPIYPNAELVEVNSASGDRNLEAGSEAASTSSDATETRWVTLDESDRVQQYYQEVLESEGWIFADNATPAAENAGTWQINAEKDDLQLDIIGTGNAAAVTNDSAPESSANSAANPASSPTAESTEGISRAETEFLLTYSGSAEPLAQAGSDSNTFPTQAEVPQPGDPDFIGPVPPSYVAGANGSGSTPSSSPTRTASAQTFSDLDEAPEELQTYVQDLAKLGVFTDNSGGSADNSAQSEEFQPNQPVNRREFARWLVETNNAIYANDAAKRIRLGVETAQPAFQDVPRTDPDFAAIQGLAEAGLIPSPLSGSSTTVTFRPDAPLTREDLVRWKVPLDLRQGIPTATVDAVQQTWGFQDATRIDPGALKAVLADYQNGEMSNIRRAFGYTTLFQPKKSATRAEAAASLWYFGYQGEGLSAQDVL